MPPVPGLKAPPPPPRIPGAQQPGGAPGTENLTTEQKQQLKDIHKKYGTFGRSPLTFVVAGQSDQTFNIELK
jgi:hypothetical protein